MEEVRVNQVGIWEKNITGKEKRFNGLKWKGAWCVRGTGAGEE